MRVDYQFYQGQLLAAKLLLYPESSEERARLDEFLEYVNSPQQGKARFEIIFKKRLAGPKQIARALRRAAASSNGAVADAKR